MPPDEKRKPRVNHLVARKLLVAAVGVATVNYVGITGCGGKEETSSSSGSSGKPPTSGNLPAPTGTTTAQPPPTSGNLPSPEPMDASPEADASNDADADDDGG